MLFFSGVFKYQAIYSRHLWKELPNLIRSIDINLAPLEDTIFNGDLSEEQIKERIDSAYLRVKENYEMKKAIDTETDREKLITKGETRLMIYEKLTAGEVIAQSFFDALPKATINPRKDI